MTLFSLTVPTPKGDCLLLATERGICLCSFPGHPPSTGSKWAKQTFGNSDIQDGSQLAILKTAANELANYLNGDHSPFSGPFDFHGASFQVQVWHMLTQIPYGRTKTYGQIASELGDPSAARAVGTACGANPIAILVPCHRVLSSTGKLTGYAGGVETKQWLLSLERGAVQQTLI